MKHLVVLVVLLYLGLRPNTVGANPRADPEPPGPLESRIARCRFIEWNMVRYDIVFCPTGIVWAPWSSTYCYCGQWKVEANVLTITWEAQSYDEATNSLIQGPALPIVSQVRLLRPTVFELTDLPQNTTIVLSE